MSLECVLGNGMNEVAVADEKSSDTTKVEPLAENPNAPEIYVDGYTGLAIRNGVAKFNCYSSRMAADLSEGQNVLTLTLAMPLPTVVSFYEALGRLLDELEEQGHIRREEVKSAKGEGDG